MCAKKRLAETIMRVMTTSRAVTRRRTIFIITVGTTSQQLGPNIAHATLKLICITEHDWANKPAVRMFPLTLSNCVQGTSPLASPQLMTPAHATHSNTIQYSFRFYMPLPKWITAHDQQHTTDAVVFTALFSFKLTGFKFSILVPLLSPPPPLSFTST